MRPAIPLLLVAVACTAARPPDPVEPGDRQQRRAAEKRARDVVHEAYASLRRGDPDGFHALLAPDLVALGPGARDRFTSRTDLLVELARLFPAKKKRRVTSRDLRVVSSPGGRAAWAVDRVEIDGAPYRFSAVLVEVDDIWALSAIQISRPVAGERAAALASSGKLAPPALPDGGVDPAAADPARLFRDGVAGSTDTLLAQIGDDKEAIAIGPGDRDTARGAKAIKKLWKRRTATIALRPGLRAAAAPDGTLAWIAAAVDAESIPRREFFVYALDGGTWKLVVAHEAIAP